MIKKFFSVSISLIFILVLTGCTITKDEISETTTLFIQEITTQFVAQTTTIPQSTVQTTYTTTPETTIQNQTESELSDNQLIELYKSAAQKSHSSLKSVQKISMKDFSVDNGGAINSIMKMFLPVISKVVENNSTEFDGITGGYANLSIDDISDISYIKNDNNIIIKMIMKEQTDSGTSDINSGSVGHAISVIGDLSSIFNQLKESGIPISVTNENIVMTYNNAQVEVTIDENGNILNGTWSYDVTLDLNNFSVGSTIVPKASVIISNVISVN